MDLLRCIDDYAHGKPLPPPEHISFVLTLRCNLQCAFCPQWRRGDDWLRNRGFLRVVLAAVLGMEGERSLELARTIETMPEKGSPAVELPQYIRNILDKPYSLTHDDYLALSDYARTVPWNDDNAVMLRPLVKGIVDDLKKEMPMDRWSSVVEEAAEMGVKEVTLTGGEPLIREGAIDLLASIKRKGMVAHLSTNGTMIGEKTAEKLVSKEVDRVIISIHGAGAETHDSLVGVTGSYNRSMAAIEYLERSKRKASAEYPKLHINFVMTGSNFNEIADFLDKISHHDTDGVTFIPHMVINKTSEARSVKYSTLTDGLRKAGYGNMWPPNNLQDLDYLDYIEIPTIYSMPDGEFLEHVAGLQSDMRGSEMQERGEDSDIDLRKLKCLSPFRELIITPSGLPIYNTFSVLPFVTPGLTLATMGLSDIWNSMEMNSLRRFFLSGHLPYVCQHWCPYEQRRRWEEEQCLQYKRADSDARPGSAGSFLRRIFKKG